MSLFVPSTCQVVADTAINSSAWCRGESIVALTAFTIDERDKEINKVIFVNGEVIFAIYCDYLL